MVYWRQEVMLMKKRTLLLIIMLIIGANTALAGGYVSLSIDQYHRVDPVERFLQYIPSIGVGWNTGQGGVEAVFNLYEEINGPVSDHNYTPYTIEAYKQVGNHRLEVNALVWVDVYDKANAYQETVLEVKLRGRVPVGVVTALVEPAVRWSDSAGGSLGIGGGLAWGPITVGVNLLDTKDYYVLGRERSVATGRVDVPIANGNHLTLEVNKALSETGRDSLWVTYRLDMAKLWEW